MRSREMTRPVDDDSFDEFAWIDQLRPLTRGDPRALELLDDAAIIPGRPGFDLVVSKDAMVEGVHFLAGETADIVARRLLRTNLSDLAAKAAEPFGYFLATAWPPDRKTADRDAFIHGLREDGDTFGLILLGGDTVRTRGPLTLSATILGWSETGRAVRRSGARAGDVAIVCGAIGDGWLGLQAALGKIDDPTGRLVRHFRLPEPLLRLRPLLTDLARAAADVSDGLIADAGHVARASSLSLDLDIDRLPLSADAEHWLSGQADPAGARLSLATGGDDYAIITAVDPGAATEFLARATALGVLAAAVGRFGQGAGITTRSQGRTLIVTSQGYRH